MAMNRLVLVMLALLSPLAFGNSGEPPQTGDRDPALAEIVRITNDTERIRRLEEYLKTVTLDSNRQVALGYLLEALVETGDLRAGGQAEAILADPLSTAAVRRRAWLAKLDLLRKTGDRTKLRELCSRIFENEKDPMLLNLLATDYDPSGALKYFQRAAKLTDLKPDMPPRSRAFFYQNYVATVLESGWTTDAIDYAEQALACEIANVRLVESGKKDLSYTPETLRKDNVAWAHLLLARSLAPSERAAEGLEHLDQAIQLNEDLLFDRAWEIWGTRGEIHARLGHNHEALEAFLRSYASKKNPAVWDKVARLAEETGQSEDSCRRRVLQLRQQMAEPLPDSRFRTSDNQEVSLADFKSPILLVNFFFPQCGPCNAEMPHLQKFYERYRDRGFGVVAINTLSREDQLVAAWKQKGGYTFPVLLAPEREYLEDKVRQQVAPTTLLVDRSRRIMMRTIGFGKGDEQSLEQEILDLLELDEHAGRIQ